MVRCRRFRAYIYIYIYICIYIYDHTSHIDAYLFARQLGSFLMNVENYRGHMVELDVFVPIYEIICYGYTHISLQGRLCCLHRI